MTDITLCYPDTPTAIETYTGGRFDVQDPRVEDVNPRDIAHALANVGRYGGHSRRFYSVAEHSIHCHDEAERRGYSRFMCLWCLLHDAAEAYLNDLPRPVRCALGPNGYNELMSRVEAVVYSRFLAVPSDIAHIKIKDVDNAVLAAEVKRLMRGRGRDWNGLGEIWPARIPSWKWWWYSLPGRAEAGFLRRLKPYSIEK